MVFFVWDRGDGGDLGKFFAPTVFDEFCDVWLENQISENGLHAADVTVWKVQTALSNASWIAAE